VPAELASGGSFACTNQTYVATASGTTPANSLLDVLVGGCSELLGFVDVVNATQPDKSNPAITAGAGGPFTLTTTGTRVTGCKDKSGTVVTPLATCLSAAAYSSYFGFTSDRVIAK
jgi:hypothetical protein